MMAAYASVLAFHNVICLYEKLQKGQEFNPLGRGNRIRIYAPACLPLTVGSIYIYAYNTNKRLVHKFTKSNKTERVFLFEELFDGEKRH